jgi:hypothetical protein
MTNNYERQLKRPFPVGSVSFRKGPGGSKELAYITARDVMQRLDEVFGIDGWSDEYDYIGSRMICKLSTRMDGTWITKSDGADDTQIEGAKGGISDALKRAAVKYGIFRYAYHPGAFNGRTAASWATPEGYDTLMDKRESGEVADFKSKLMVA